MIVDSDVLIDLLNGRTTPGLSGAVASGALRTSTLAVFEVLRGISAATRRADAGLLFTLVPALPLTEEAAVQASTLDQHLHRAGSPIGEIDTLFAAVALTAGRPLLTRNRRHFDRVPGLVVESP